MRTMGISIPCKRLQTYLWLQVLLSAGADIDSEDEQGDTPFVHAFRGKHREVIMLISRLSLN